MGSAEAAPRKNVVRVLRFRRSLWLVSIFFVDGRMLVDAKEKNDQPCSEKRMPAVLHAFHRRPTSSTAWVVWLGAKFWSRGPLSQVPGPFPVGLCGWVLFM